MTGPLATAAQLLAEHRRRTRPTDLDRALAQRLRDLFTLAEEQPPQRPGTPAGLRIVKETG
jgi:hypothetical protein